MAIDKADNTQRYAVGKKINEYFESGQINRDVRADHFSKGLPITYISDENENIMIREYPDGRIEKVAI